MKKFKELFETKGSVIEISEGSKYLTFKLTDSAWYGGHTQNMFDDMDDRNQISVYMNPDMSNSWISSKPLSSSEMKKLKKEIQKALPYDMKPDAYKFGQR